VRLTPAAAPNGGRVGLIIGAFAGGAVGTYYGRWLCLETAPADASCTGAMLLTGSVGALAGALMGYVIGSGVD
jgi:hypothetical protein